MLAQTQTYTHTHTHTCACAYLWNIISTFFFLSLQHDAKRYVHGQTSSEHIHTQSCTLDWAEFIKIFMNPLLYAFQIKALPPLSLPPYFLIEALVFCAEEGHLKSGVIFLIAIFLIEMIFSLFLFLFCLKEGIVYNKDDNYSNVKNEFGYAVKSNKLEFIKWLL